MLKFLFGVIVGIIVATIGFSGMAKIADKGVAEIQKAVKPAAK